MRYFRHAAPLLGVLPTARPVLPLQYALYASCPYRSTWMIHKWTQVYALHVYFESALHVNTHELAASCVLAFLCFCFHVHLPDTWLALVAN